VEEAAALKQQTLGKYEVIASLGQGGMATVYLALVAGPAGRVNRTLPEGKEADMLRLALVFLVIALIAGFFGFFQTEAAAAGIARILFFVFLVIFIVSLIFGGGWGRRTPPPV